ncbi:glycine cleavage system protein GcvH [Paenibacillus sp. NPDC056579]|uniref:glycine cleavage system protein GcvH n=1 Tax=unclassified Paenibacillus TaxID=185978 RepID=UPI001EF84FAE|nr:glycine cleavage system protein GcvH [Paenibacillus sp. H1-7]ULL17992.1 glycine cleavage system protein GcvH [Paenibacillus sp. H1-7]
MSEVRAGLRYTEEHEWAEKRQAAVVRIGITDFAQQQLGDIVFVELPKVGARLEAHAPMGTIESVKTVSDLFSPVAGTVTAVNEGLLDSPELVNSEPYEAGWIVEVEVDGDTDQALDPLLTAEAYRQLIAGQE